MSSETNQLTAEQRFRQAFERLKAGEPKTLNPGTPVSQNNVAKEAGCDPSALKKSRFPELIREIQAYVELNADQQPPSKRQVVLKQRAARKEHNDRLAEVILQRDIAQSKLVSAQRRIVELVEELKLARAQIDQLRPPPTPLHR